MEKRELHYKYGISYLVAIIVALLAFGLFDVPSLVDKISFALTIASLVLAVVAIIYTFLAANKQDTQLASLIETHHSISVAAAEIQQAAGALLGHVSAIPTRLELMTAKIDSLTQPEAARLLPNGATPISSIEQSDKRFKRFLGGLPFGAMSILYAFYIANQKGRVLTESTMAAWSPMSFHFAFGVLSGAEAAEFIEFKFHKDEIIPISCSDDLKRNIKAYLTEIADIVSSDHGESLKKRMVAAEEEFS